MTFLDKLKLGLKNPKNFKNYYWHLWDLKNRPSQKRADFLSAQIEPTTRCNLKCPMCLHAFDKMQKPDMTLDQFKNILDQLPFLANVTLQGIGEPFLNPDIFEMIDEAKKRKIHVGLTTNATLLNKEKKEKLVESDIDWVYISIDTAEKEKYEKIRRGASYEKTIDNIRNLIKTDNKINIGFWVLMMEETAGDAGGIIDLAKDLGIKKIVFQNAVHNWGYHDFKNNSVVDTNLKHLTEVIKDKSERPEIEININQRRGKKCHWPWRALYITCDGYLTPCCMQGSDPEIINFGNIFKTSVEKIVNNQKYQDFRQSLNSDTPPQICKNCPVYYQQKIVKV